MSGTTTTISSRWSTTTISAAAANDEDLAKLLWPSAHAWDDFLRKTGRSKQQNLDQLKQAALLRKKGELRDFEAKYRSAQKAYVEAMDRFEDELNAVEGLVRERDGAYRQLGSSSGEIVAGFARGADPQGTKGVLDRLQQKAVRARSRFGKIFR